MLAAFSNNATGCPKTQLQGLPSSLALFTAGSATAVGRML